MLISIQSLRAKSFLKQLKEAKKCYTSRKDKQYHACLTLIATALVGGADIAALVKQTGYREEFVARVAGRMRQASLWKEDQAEIDEWAKSDFMVTIFAHACVASGRASREINSVGKISYFDLI
jgi:hypothetical protein